MTIAALPGGGSVEALSGGDDARGFYLLAGYPDLSGTVPYRWISREEAAGLRRLLPFSRAAKRQSADPHQGRPRG